MTDENKNKLLVGCSIVGSFITGCVVGRYSKGQFAILRILIGSLFLAFAVGLDIVGWLGVIYFLRCVAGIVGATIIGKLTDFDVHSLGVLLLGIIVYFISMAPNSFDQVSAFTTIDQDILQVAMRLVGAFLIFSGFHNPNKE